MCVAIACRCATARVPIFQPQFSSKERSVEGLANRHAHQANGFLKRHTLRIGHTNEQAVPLPSLLLETWAVIRTAPIGCGSLVERHKDSLPWAAYAASGDFCSLITLWVTISLISCGRGNETTERFLEAAVTSYDAADASLWHLGAFPQRERPLFCGGLALIGSFAFLPAGCKKRASLLSNYAVSTTSCECRISLRLFFYNVLRCVLIFENEVSGVIRFGFCPPGLYVRCL